MKKLLLFTLVLLAGSIFQRSTATDISNPSAAAAFDEDFYGGAYLLFAGEFGGDVTPKEIASNTKLDVDGCAAGSKIYQFTLHVKKDGRTSKFTGKSNELTKEMHTALKGLSPGDEFSFKHVKAQLPKKDGEVDVWAKTFYVVGSKA